MKKTLKVLSLLCALVLIIGTVSVGMSAYAASDDIIGDYDFEITNVYKDIDWNNVTAYKAETHVHTVRSDADTEVDDMIHKYYELGFDAMALTDHGTVNYGWANNQARVLIFDYQFFVHGPVDNLSGADYKNIITGQRGRSINSGKGMMEIPLGNEMNGASVKKYHVNGYYADAAHGDLNIVDGQGAIRNAVVEYYNKGGFTHINHVGEWSGGNDDPEVYTASFVSDFASIFEDYCPNRGGRNDATQTAWMSSHKGEAGVIGMELVNTSDSRTHNDRRMVYDESLKILAPKGINMFGFCEDDAHEYSDCDRNAQYFLINNDKNVAVNSADYDRSSATGSGSNCAYHNDNTDPMDKVQNYYRDAMFYGEFYACSKNSKNTYELGNGFSASGAYPSVSNISVDQSKNQISITYKDATKLRVVADGEVIETHRTAASQQTVVIDLNRNETKINSYVRIYLTGAGGITYLQPFLVKKTATAKSTVQFITPSTDTNIEVKDSNGSVVSDELKYENNYYVLDAGEYTYTASRRGFQTKTDIPFEVTRAQVDAHEQIKITVELDEISDVSYAYFYAPETIYLKVSDDQTFEKYIDRDNEVNGALHTDAQDTGNIFFYREGASNIKLSYAVTDGATSLREMNVESLSAEGDTLATRILSGAVARPLVNGEYVYIKWMLTYDYKGIPYKAYQYTYIYETKVDNTTCVGAGALAQTNKAAGWSHSTMRMVASLYVTGIHNLESTNNASYKYLPCNNIALEDTTSTTVTGKGYLWKEDISSNDGSCDGISYNTDLAYIYADRSRIQNWSQIPYFTIGFDLNSGKECTGKNDSTRCAARLAFDQSCESIKNGTNEQYDTSINYLYDMKFSSQTNYTVKKDYNLDTAGYDSEASGTTSEGFHSLRKMNFYQVDNETSDRKLIKELPNANTKETVVPISAYAIGSKEARDDEIFLEVQITLVNINKSSLRTEFNNTVKGCFQEEWFQDVNEWNYYQNMIAEAGKVLGNPTAEPEQIDEATANLQAIVDNFHLKTGTATVEHWWKLGNETGLIYAENSYTYEYGQDLSANAADITGYTFANEFESFCEGEKIQNGTDNFDLQFAEKTSYSWKFYYTPNQYNVTYNSMGADPISSYDSTVLFGQTYNVATEFPQKAGFNFGGWFLDNTQKNYSAGESFKWNVADDGEFFAQWVPNVYNVTYDVNGGDTLSIGTNYKKATYGDAYSVCPNVPTKTGYAFAGWLLNGDTIHTAGSTVFWNFASDGTFVAQWEIADYTVSFNLMSEDAYFDGNPQTAPTISVRYEEPYGTLPDAYRTGYNVEWYTDPNYPVAGKVTAGTTVSIASDHTLYAKWIPIDYTITYNLDGGSVVGNNPTTYNADTPTFTLKEPERTGYVFTGWSGTGIAGLEELVEIVKGSTGARTYTANWELSGFKITYNLNGGINDPRNTEDYRVTNAVTVYPATKAGFSFEGWSEPGSEIKEKTFVIPAGIPGDKIYNANWALIDYEITYDYDSATIEPSGNRVSYNIKTPSFPINEPQKTGYNFQGWNCSYDEFDGTNITIPQGTAAGDLHFKAVWVEKGAFDVRYDLDHGVVRGTNPSSYKEGQSFNITPPEKDGYYFSNWLKKVGDADPVHQTEGKILSTDSGNIVFTAVWGYNDFNITYSGGGVIPTANTNHLTYNVTTPTFTLINPIKTGYTFSGWSGTNLASLYTTVTIPKGSFGDRSYTANWTPNTYTIAYDYNGGTGAFVTSYTSSTSGIIGAPTRAGYTFTGWTICYNSFTWEPGTITSAGKFAPQENTYRSEAIVLRADSTYTIDSAVAGLKIYTFDKAGTFLNEYAGTVTPAADCVAYIVAETSSPNSLRTAKLNISGTPESYTLVAENAATIGSAGDMYFTANWTDDTYSIRYVLDDGAGWGVDSDNNPLPNPNPETYKVDTSDIILKNPTKEGYRFEGWEYEGQLLNPAVIPVGSTGNRTYTTRFAVADYSITYSGIDGAAVATNPETYTINSPDITLNNPGKTGYTFEGWIGTGLGGTASKNVVIAHGSTGDREYTATWNALDYSITYSGVEGATVSNPNSYTIETETFSLNNPTKTGAVFAGWSGSGINGTLMNVTIAKGSTGNKSYTATWTYTTYTIDYYDVPAGQESLNPTTYDMNTADITLAKPSKTGYTFLGWTGTGLDSATEYPVIKTGSTGNRRYRATWQADTYTISYQLAGGQVAQNANPATYTIESPTITLVNPQRTGFTFRGWTGTGLDDASMEVIIPMGSTGNRSYTATWDEVFYTISYSGLENATLSAANPSSYTENTNTFTLNNPEKLGYEFTGWSGTGITGSGRSKEVEIIKGSKGNRSYTANWELKQYTINYVFNGGSEGALKNPTTYTITSAPITLNAPIQTGYVFEGWSSDYFDDVRKEVTIGTGERTGNITFTANWKIGNYTITLDAGDGVLPEGLGSIPETTATISGATASIKYASDTPDFTIGQPTYEGHTFIGWQLEGVPGTTKTISVPTGSTGNRNYTAVWADSENALSYNLNGGEVAGENPSEYVTNSGTIKLINPTKGGYKFAGWTFTEEKTGIVTYNSLTKTATIDTSKGGSVDFVAEWTPSNYRITYNLNGGTTSAANDKTYTIESEFTLNNPIRNGYEFLGWTGTDLAEGIAHKTVSITKGSSGNRTYTAKWAEEPYDITYDYNGGSTDIPNPSSYTVITDSFTLNNPERTGYTFTGWTGTGLTSAQRVVTIPTGSTGDRSYTATFSLDTYTITYFGLEGATLDRVDKYTSEMADFTLGTPVKDGYTFLGWMGENDVNPVPNVSITKGSSGNKEFTAVWTPTVYTIDYELNGGSVAGENRETYTIETPTFSILNPTKDGYIFTGWSETAGGEKQTKVVFKKGTTGNKTLIANWDTAPYTISYTGLPSDLPDGISLPRTYTSSVEVEIDNPAMAGYYFAGWTGTGLSGKTRDLVLPVGTTGNRVYKANWTIINYTLTLELDGGTATSSVNPTYTVDTPTFTLPTPTKSGNRFAGWTGDGIPAGETRDVVTIEQGSTGDRTYTATWSPRTGNTHLIKFYGYNNAPLYLFTTTDKNNQTVPCNFIEWPIGTELNEAIVNENIKNIDVTVGYQIKGWDIDFNADKYKNSDEDVIVHADWDVGPDVFDINVNGTKSYVATAGQYETFTATTDYTNASGELFSYWVATEVDEYGNAIGGQEIASYYRNYTFYAHSHVVLLAVYGANEAVRASTRISSIEKYDQNYDWFTPYSERSVATELVLNKHGIIFTTDETIGKDANAFVVGAKNVNNGVASSKGLAGMWSLSIRNPYKLGIGNTVYVRSYVTVIDENGHSTDKYSMIRTYENVEDTTPGETTEGVVK